MNSTKNLVFNKMLRSSLNPINKSLSVVSRNSVAPVFSSMINKFHSNANHNAQSNDEFIQSIMKSSQIQELKKSLNSDGRIQVSIDEFKAICKEKASLTEEEAEKLLFHFHESSTYLNFKDSPKFEKIVFLQPEELFNRVYSNVNEDSLSASLHGHEKRIVELQNEFQALSKVKEELDIKANGKINNYFRLGGVYLLGQTLFLAKMTWIDYGWDVVEPITYFVTFSAVLGGYLYFTLFNREYTYGDLMNRLYEKKRVKLYKSSGFDINQYNSLRNQLESELGAFKDNCVDLYGKNIPPRYLKFFHDHKELEGNPQVSATQSGESTETVTEKQ